MQRWLDNSSIIRCFHPDSKKRAISFRIDLGNSDNALHVIDILTADLFAASLPALDVSNFVAGNGNASSIITKATRFSERFYLAEKRVD